jgi:hypothetical protein
MPRRYQFNLRFLLVLIMLVASYWAGWVSHRAWQRRNIEQAIDDALQQVKGPLQVEKVDELDVVVLRGGQADVEAMQRGINKIESAARQ